MSRTARIPRGWIRQCVAYGQEERLRRAALLDSARTRADEQDRRESDGATDPIPAHPDTVRTSQPEPQS